MPDDSLAESKTPSTAPALARRLALLVRASGFLLGMLVTALAAMLLFVSVSMGDRQIGEEVAAFASAEYGRSFTAPEGVQLSLLPWPSLRTGAVSLSVSGGAETFASWKSADFELDVLALLSRRLVIRHARIDGLALRLARDRRGVWNAADLMKGLTEAAANAPFQAPLALRLEGLALNHASVIVDDAPSGRSLQWRALDFGTDALRAKRGGRVRLIAQLVSRDAAIEGKFSLSARYRFGETLASGSLNAVQARYVGDIAGTKSADASLVLGSAEWQTSAGRQPEWKFADVQSSGIGRRDALALEWSAALLGADWREGLQARSVSAQLKWRAAGASSSDKAAQGEMRLSLQDVMRGEGAVSTAAFDGNWQARAGQRGAQGKLRGQLRLDAKAARLAAERLVGEVSLSHPALKGGTAQASVKGHANWLLAAPPEGTRGELVLDTLFGSDAVHAALRLLAGPEPLVMARVESKRFDVDRLIVPARVALSLPDNASLQGWRLEGVVHAENLTLGGMRMASAHVPVKVAAGRLSLPEHALRLYGGKLDGSIDYEPAKQMLTIFEALREVQLEPLLRDADAKASFPLSGLTNATLDVSSQGTSLETIPDLASGVLRVYAKNARWHGVDLSRSMLALNAGKPAANDAQSTTPLGEVSAAFVVKGPTLVAEKLVARSEAVSFTAGGTMQYASGVLDLRLLARAGNEKALAELRGKRMALRASGPLAQPRLTIDASPPAPPAARAVQPAMVSR